MTLSDTLGDEYETELSRLGSSKVLYALTDGEMDADAVTAVIGGRALARAETLEGWDDGHGDGDGSATGDDVLSSAAAAERAYAETLDVETDPTVSPVEETLRSLEGDDRFAGLLAATLVEKRITDQVVGFFVGQADPRTANDVRDHVSALDDRLEALEERVSDDGDAVEIASRVVEAAYDEYVDRLEAQGVNPKPVC